MKQFCKFLRNRDDDDYFFKKMKLLATEPLNINHIKMQKFVMFLEKILKINILKMKNIPKFGNIVIMQRYSVPKKLPISFDNGSSYAYHFIKKELF